jgi:hypothetical protein
MERGPAALPRVRICERPAIAAYGDGKRAVQYFFRVVGETQ